MLSRLHFANINAPSDLGTKIGDGGNAVGVANRFPGLLRTEDPTIQQDPAQKRKDTLPFPRAFAVLILDSHPGRPERQKRLVVRHVPARTLGPFVSRQGGKL
jgi:hypothetical protein